MSGFELFNGDTEMRITLGSRVVMTTEGTMINLLPPAYDLSTTIPFSFPDIIKDYRYGWQHVFDDFAGNVGYDSACFVELTACPQEFEQEINITAAPAGADIFVGKLILSRTAAPSHTWNGNVITPKQPQGVWIPFISGSLLLEAEVGFARACSIYVSGGNLKLHWEQSVTTAPGGWGLYGNAYSWIAGNDGSGGENVFGSVAGLPILQVSSYNAPSFQVPSNINSPPYDARTRRGGALACPLPNFASYNYASTYQLTLSGSFGRRS